MKITKLVSLISSMILTIIFGILFTEHDCFADGFTISPVNQDKVLIPGSEDIITFTISNPADAVSDTEYEVSVMPFKMENNDDIYFENNEDYSQIVNWISFDEKTGIIKPDEAKELSFKVTVPENAPAGGQYCAIIVSVAGENTGMIDQRFAMSHLIYAEVAGETIRKGQLNSMDISGFMFSGDITAGASVTNTGNVHSRVKHTLRVFPLIGNEEYYTNEEDPQENVIMPEATRYTNVSWEKTPSIGIFRVQYTVEFEGVKNELSKIVIICPLWLLFIIALIIALLIGKFIFGKRKNKE